MRKCISVSPSFSISSIMILRMSACSFSSFGRNTNPVPYFPFSGTGMPCSKINSWGIWSMIPAPSPVLLSAPSAPLWRIFSNTLSAESTISCDLLPWMFTNIPTPHASCSFAASYSPLHCCWKGTAPPSLLNCSLFTMVVSLLYDNRCICFLIDGKDNYNLSYCYELNGKGKQ